LSKEQGEKLERAIAKCIHMQKVITKPMYSMKPSHNKRIVARNFHLMKKLNHRVENEKSKLRRKEERDRLKAEEEANDSDNSANFKEDVELKKRMTFKDIMDEIDKIERNYDKIKNTESRSSDLNNRNLLSVNMNN